MATVNVTQENFEKLLNEKDILLLDFWATWCGPCRTFTPIFEKSAEAHPDMTFGKVNTEEQQALAGAFGIRSIPTLMIFREKVLLFQQAGALPADVLEDVISKVKELDMDEVRAEIEREHGPDDHTHAPPKTGT